MKACVLVASKTYEVKDIPVPELKDGQVLLRVLTAAICVNDVRDYQGENKFSYPHIGGHEYCAVVEKLGPNVNENQIHVGDHVINYIIDDCGICDDCKHGHENICSEFMNGVNYNNPNGYSGFFGFVEYAVADARDLYVYPKDTPSDVASLTEPLACVINSIQRTPIQMGDDVAILGGGVMGLLHVICAKRQGARVIVSEVNPERAEVARKLGADVTINPMEADAVEQIKKLTQGRGANVVFNTTAIPSVAAQAIEMTAKSGYCNMFSSIHPNEPILVDAGRLHKAEIYVTGTQNGTKESFRRAIDCISKGILDLNPIISKTYAPEDIVEALDYAASPESYKVLIEFSK